LEGAYVLTFVCALPEIVDQKGHLSQHELSIIHYSGMAFVKLVVICFFFFPWLAIRFVLWKAEA
jgi:hypothetical protein